MFLSTKVKLNLKMSLSTEKSKSSVNPRQSSICSCNVINLLVVDCVKPNGINRIASRFTGKGLLSDSYFKEHRKYEAEEEKASND